MSQHYSVNHVLINHLLTQIQTDQIAIPEIQRPFVRKSKKVRDLMDSLYKGYPVGYIIVWRNPDVRLKDGTISQGKQIIIDGQQRITALTAALLGQEVINAEYNKVRIKIAFNPIEEKFDTLTPAIQKDKTRIPDIAEIIAIDSSYQVIEDYHEKNSELDKSKIAKSIERLYGLKQSQIGMIELNKELKIDEVTEIFIRINSKGVVLSQADFAMSKIASYGDFGINLRKAIDYFCHIAKESNFYKHIRENDAMFVETDYASQIQRIKDSSIELYGPDYKDLIRVAFLYKFKRGKISDLVSLLSGRNFETRQYEEAIVKDSFEKLKEGVLTFVNQYNIQEFLKMIMAAGFIAPHMIKSKNALNFAYALFLLLRNKGYSMRDIEHFVKRRFAFSLLKGRYAGSAESRLDYDIKLVEEHGIEKALEQVEASELSEGYRDAGLFQDLDKSSTSTPYIRAYWAAQIVNNEHALFSNSLTVRSMIEVSGDIHHIFPKKYLQKHGLSSKNYNKIANYVYLNTPENIAVSSKAPNIYFPEYKQKMSSEEFDENLSTNSLPPEVISYDITHYDEFLSQRRKLMAEKIKNWYYKL